MTLYEPKTLSQEISDDPELRQEVEREWFADSTIIKIEKKMEELGLTRKKLAERMKCSPANVTQLLRHGRSNLTLDTLMGIALAMEHRFIAPELVELSTIAPWETCSVHIPMSAPAWISEGDGTTYALAAPDEYPAARAGVVPYDMQSTCESHG